jgi:hypothetical protein
MVIGLPIRGDCGNGFAGDGGLLESALMTWDGFTKIVDRRT